jgi:hypothetical protein
MSAESISVRSPIPVAAPRGAAWAASAAVLLRRFGRSAWNALEDAGHRRAARELLAVAERVQSSDPELARSLRAASLFDARSVRRIDASKPPMGGRP